MLNAKFLFWLCVFLAVLNLAAGAWLASKGVKSWSSILFGIYWLFLAWVHARRIPS